MAPGDPILMPSLYPYQRTAVEFAQSTGGRCILGDDMGLGKTVEALAYVTTLPSPDVLIVWLSTNGREIQRHGRG